MIFEEDVEEFIEHFGRKGMRWGVRGATSTAGLSPRQINRQKNVASRAKERKEVVKSIEKSRAKVSSGKAKAELNKAKQQHAANKVKLGSREARKILNEAKEKHFNEVQNSRMSKNGKEAAKNALLVGGVVLAFYTAGRLLGSGR